MEESGFGSSKISEPNIVFDSYGTQEKEIDVGKTDSLTKDIDVVIQKKEDTDTFGVLDVEKKKPERQVSSAGSSVSDTSVLEYNGHLNFGDIADPQKHKTQPDNNSDIASEYSKTSFDSLGKDSFAPTNKKTEPPFGDFGKPDRDQENREKQDYLIKLQKLEKHLHKKGIKLSRELGMKSKLDDIKFEYEKQKRLLEQDSSVEFMKSVLITAVNGIEMMNKRFDPIGAKLDGWSESITENIGTYESIFEKLYDKYCDSVEIAPEVELLMTLISSAFMYHMMQQLFKTSIPNLPQAMMQDPNLMSGLGKAAARAADMSQGVPQPSNEGMGGPSPGFDIGSLMGNLLSGINQNQMQNPAPPPRPVNPRMQEPPISGLNQTSTTPMEAPKNDSFKDDVSDLSSLSNGSGYKIKRGKSDRKIIDLDF